MITLQNTETSKEIRDVTKIQQTFDPMPNKVSDYVQLVAEVNPKIVAQTNRTISITASNAVGSATLETTRNFNMTGYFYSFVKDAASTCNNVNAFATFFETNASTVFININSLSLTADSKIVTHNFTKPIKLKKGTNIGISADAVGAQLRMNLIVYGYYDEVQD